MVVVVGESLRKATTTTTRRYGCRAGQEFSMRCIDYGDAVVEAVAGTKASYSTSFHPLSDFSTSTCGANDRGFFDECAQFGVVVAESASEASESVCGAYAITG